MDGTAPVDLFIVTGTMGAGKSTVAERLVPRLPDHVVFDIDWVIESLGMVAGRPIPSHQPSWPGVRDTWLAIAAAIGRGERSTVLCGPFTPSDLDELPSLSLIDKIHWLLLDCSDVALKQRLDERRWQASDIDDAVNDAAELRTHGFTALRTDALEPEAVADEVAAWVRGVE